MAFDANALAAALGGLDNRDNDDDIKLMKPKRPDATSAEKSLADALTSKLNAVGGPSSLDGPGEQSLADALTAKLNAVSGPAAMPGRDEQSLADALSAKLNAVDGPAAMPGRDEQSLADALSAKLNRFAEPPGASAQEKSLADALSAKLGQVANDNGDDDRESSKGAPGAQEKALAGALAAALEGAAGGAHNAKDPVPAGKALADALTEKLKVSADEEVGVDCTQLTAKLNLVANDENRLEGTSQTNPSAVGFEEALQSKLKAAKAPQYDTPPDEDDGPTKDGDHLKAPRTTAVISAAALAMLDDDEDDADEEIPTRGNVNIQAGSVGSAALPNRDVDEDEEDDRAVMAGRAAPRPTAVISAAQLAQVDDDDDDDDEDVGPDLLYRGTKAPKNTVCMNPSQLGGLLDSTGSVAEQDDDDDVPLAGVRAPQPTSIVGMDKLAQLSDDDDDDDSCPMGGKGIKAPATTAVISASKLAQLEDDDDDEIEDTNAPGLKAPRATQIVSDSQFAQLDDDDDDMDDDGPVLSGMKAPKSTVVVTADMLGQCDDEDDDDIPSGPQDLMVTGTQVKMQQTPSEQTLQTKQPVVPQRQEANASATIAAQAAALGLASISSAQLKQENEKLAGEIQALRLEIARRRREAAAAAGGRGAKT